MNPRTKSSLACVRLLAVTFMVAGTMVGQAHAESPAVNRTKGAAPAQAAGETKPGLSREDVLRELKRAQDDGSMREIRRRRVYTTS